MKNVKTILCVVLAAVTFSLLGNSANEKLEALAKGKISGVTGIKKNEDGSIRSLLIIGRANLNRLLDEDEAEESAREDAEINASVAFSEYLDKSVTVARKRSNVTATSSSKTEKNGEVSGSSTADTISVKSQEFSQISKAIISGMKEIYAGIHNGKYVIIYAWDKAECAQLKDVILTMSETAQTAIKEAKEAESRIYAPTGSHQKPVPSKGGKSSKRPSRAIEEGGSASADAGDYL